MKIEKLTENKIRIILNIEDLETNNIDFESVLNNTPETQTLILSILNKAEKEVGFYTQDCKILIEACASFDGNFVFTITKTSSPALPEGTVFTRKKPHVKKKSFKLDSNAIIYSFQNFDEFCEFCNYINGCFLNESLKKLRNASLILYKNNYYLVLNSVKLSSSELKSYSYGISEFASFVRNEALFERKLKEYGSIIINKNAISTCLKYFSNK